MWYLSCTPFPECTSREISRDGEEDMMPLRGVVKGDEGRAAEGGRCRNQVEGMSHRDKARDGERCVVTRT